MSLGRVLVGVLLVYVALDLASPLVPGAFAFDPDECVEGFRAERHRTPGAELGTLVVPATPGDTDGSLALRAVRPAAPARVCARRVAPLPRADLTGAPPASSPPSPDDH